jgi:hypothetical protein
MIELKTPRVVKGWGLGKKILPANSGFIDNGYGRKFATQERDPNMFDAFSAFGLNLKYREPQFQIFTGIHYLAGACTHIHQDEATDGYVHVRCNVMLEKPDCGGLPIINETVLDVEVGDLWIVFASLEKHGSTQISQPTRVIKSFGGLFPKYEIQQIIVNNEIKY